MGEGEGFRGLHLSPRSSVIFWLLLESVGRRKGQITHGETRGDSSRDGCWLGNSLLGLGTFSGVGRSKRPEGGGHGSRRDGLFWGDRTRPGKPSGPDYDAAQVSGVGRGDGGVVSILAQGDVDPRPSQHAASGPSTLVQQDSLGPDVKCKATRGPGGTSQGLSCEQQDPTRPLLPPPIRGSRRLRPTNGRVEVLGTAGTRVSVSSTTWRLAPATKCPRPYVTSPTSRTRPRPQGGQRNQNSNRAMEAALCPEFLSFCSKVTIGIIFLQNDSCHDNQSKFSCSETDVSFS